MWFPDALPGRRGIAVCLVGVTGLGVAVGGLASCARGDQRALLSAVPRRAVTLVSVSALAASTSTTTASAPVTTPPESAPATPTTAPPTTTVATLAPPAPTTSTLPPVPAAEPAPALAAPLVPLGSGAKGEAVVALQQRLLDLGFWIDAADGEYGGVTTQAVMAFQKYYVDAGLKPSGRADQATVDALAAVTLKPFAPVADGPAPEGGTVVVVDKGRQVLHLTQAGRTVWTLNTSTGTGRDYTEVDQKRGGTITGHAITPEGTFSVYREFSSGWESGELGQLYRPKYFAGGVAVHGSNSIPNVPASHGCVRITTTAMDWIWANDLMPRGTVVVVRG